MGSPHSGRSTCSRTQRVHLCWTPHSACSLSLPLSPIQACMSCHQDTACSTQSWRHFLLSRDNCCCPVHMCRQKNHTQLCVQSSRKTLQILQLQLLQFNIFRYRLMSCSQLHYRPLQLSLQHHADPTCHGLRFCQSACLLTSCPSKYCSVPCWSPETAYAAPCAVTTCEASHFDTTLNL